MTVFLSERDIEALLNMDEVVAAVEEAFRNQGASGAQNYRRTRSRGSDSVLSVMHANSSYLGRAGLKAYLSTKERTRFLVVLFDTSSASPLAVMAADALGRFRTGAASAVATKHLYRKASGKLALFGSGRQALAQAVALQSVMKLDEVSVWSPDQGHREAFARLLRERGMDARSPATPAAAAEGADVASTITSSREPFLDEKMLKGASHLNVCGGNVPGHAEVTDGVVEAFDSVVVDDLQQAKEEYGDLIRAAGAGKFNWDSAVELAEVVSANVRPSGRTLFKSGGAAIEDVATANLVYEKAMAAGRFAEFEFY